MFNDQIPFEDSEPYPENKRPVVDFRQKPGQLKRLAPWEERAVFQVRLFLCFVEWLRNSESLKDCGA